MTRPSRPHTLAGSLLSSLVLALSIVGVTIGELGIAATASAVSVPPPPETTPEEALEELAAPIALYPDELLSVVLPASTYPLQIVQAARFLEKRKADASLEPSEDWDASILGLLNYPEVVEIMNEDLDWTWALGEAVAEDQEAVMAAIQRFRARVDAAGNLQSDDKVRIEREDGEDGAAQQIIVIESASPEVIYVPVYQPATVVVRYATPYSWYYSSPYPYYYHPAALFWTGMFLGSAVAYSLHWNHHHHHHHGHYGGNVYVHRNVNVDVHRHARVRRDSGTTWQVDRSRGKKSGARPSGSRDRTRRSGDRTRTDTRPSDRRRSSRPTTTESERRRTREETTRDQRRTREERKAERPKRDDAGAERPKRDYTRTERPKREDANAERRSGDADRAKRRSDEARRNDRSTQRRTSKVDRSREGRSATRNTTPQRSRQGSFGDYDRGSRSRNHSARGAGSRGGGRSGGGRSRGGGRSGGGGRGGRR